MILHREDCSSAPPKLAHLRADDVLMMLTGAAFVGVVIVMLLAWAQEQRRARLSARARLDDDEDALDGGHFW